MRDITLEDTFRFHFTTRAFATGIPTALAGVPVLSVHEQANDTLITAGVTVDASVGTSPVVGLNEGAVVATAANGYELGKSYCVFISTGTVGGVSVVGEVVQEFTIGLSAAAVDLANGTDGLGAIKADTAATLVDTGTTIPATITTMQNDLDIITDSDGVILGAAGVDLIWDEPLTGGTHNVSTSSGKRLRQIDAAFEITSGTAVAGSTSTTINLNSADGADAATDEIYAGDRVVIVAGTGVGEHGLILSYASGTQIATMSKAWVITPDNTSEYILSPADADVELWNDNSVTGDGDWAALKAETAAILVDTGTTIPGTITTLQTDSTLIVADTNELQTDWVDGGRLDLIQDIIAADTTTDIPALIATAQADLDIITDSDGVILGAAGVDLVWDEVLTAATHNVASSSGKRLRLASEIVQVDSAVDDPGTAATTTVFNTDLTEVDDFWNDTILVFTSGALLGQARAILDYANASGAVTLDEALTSAPLDNVTFTIISTHIHPISQIADSVWDEPMAGHVTADTAGLVLNDLMESASTIVVATVDTVTNTHTPTTTEFQADDVTEATADHYNGRIVIFTSGVLQDQATDITDYVAVGGIGQFTVTAMTEAPANNDTFVIV